MKVLILGMETNDEHPATWEPHLAIAEVVHPLCHGNHAVFQSWTSNATVMWLCFHPIHYRPSHRCFEDSRLSALPDDTFSGHSASSIATLRLLALRSQQLGSTKCGNHEWVKSYQKLWKPPAPTAIPRHVSNPLSSFVVPMFSAQVNPSKKAHQPEQWDDTIRKPETLQHSPFLPARATGVSPKDMMRFHCFTQFASCGYITTRP